MMNNDQQKNKLVEQTESKILEEQFKNDGFSKDNEIIISPTKQAIIKFRHNRLSMIGFWIFVTIVVLVVVMHFYSIFTGFDFAYTDADMKYLPPSLDHIMGTDVYGRDLLVRVVEGGWISLQVGFLSTVMSLTIGITMGSIAGFFGGRVDSIIMRGSEIIASFPFLALAFTISSIARDLPGETRLFIIIILLGFITWTGLAKMVRGQILSLRQQEFIIATESLGIKKKNQIIRHLIPNVLSLVVVYATLTFAISILSEASLSFLNLSVSEPVPTWGGLLSMAARDSYVLRTYWWTWVFPGGMLFLFIMSINLIGEGLRDAIDPKSEYVTKEQRQRAKEERKADRLARREKKLSVKENV